MGRHCGLQQDACSSATIGFQATITTRAVKLPPGSPDAFSIAWVGVSNDAGNDAPKQRWAQMGYANYHAGDEAETEINIYVEVQSGPDDSTDYYRAYFGTPAAGVNTYQATLDVASGSWSFFCNAAPVTVYQHDGWKTAQNLAAGFFAETSGYDAPYVGSEEEPCDFTECAIRVGAAYVNVDFTQGFSTMNDSAEFMLSEDAANAFALYEFPADEE